jgi:hypothetical protein
MYLVLDDDFSNFDEGLRRFTDLSERSGIVDATYEYVSVASYAAA